YDGIGGVETAARTMHHVLEDNIEFTVSYICSSTSRKKNLKLIYNPFRIITSAMSFRKKNIDVLIVSLWRSLIVGILVKIFKPKIILITFLHLESNAHFIDYICHKISLFLSTHIFADSDATKRGRLSPSMQKKCSVISFVSKRIDPLSMHEVNTNFIFWGRITPQKGLNRAIKIFNEIHKKYSKAHYWIIGPDGGSLIEIKSLLETLGLTESVTFIGPSTYDEILIYARQASFYLQTSLVEGMAMSVMESMQLGLVPIVTPVGEIIAYCQDEKNSVIVKSNKYAAEKVLYLIESNTRYQEYRTMTIATWNNKPIYKESVINACKNILNKMNL
ncbi:MAG: glycosyltransferase family 4 protein, partial [Paludibacter sp.]